MLVALVTCTLSANGVRLWRTHCQKQDMPFTSRPAQLSHRRAELVVRLHARRAPAQPNVNVDAPLARCPERAPAAGCAANAVRAAKADEKSAGAARDPLDDERDP